MLYCISVFKYMKWFLLTWMLNLCYFPFVFSVYYCLKLITLLICVVFISMLLCSLENKENHHILYGLYWPFFIMFHCCREYYFYHLKFCYNLIRINFKKIHNPIVCGTILYLCFLTITNNSYLTFVLNLYYFHYFFFIFIVSLLLC